MAAAVVLVVAYVAFSGSYDSYLLWRDGHLPIESWPNAFASGVLYLCAGLVFSLERNQERAAEHPRSASCGGMEFGFQRQE